jgi:predicted GNAT family acetyltransferase
MVGFILDNGLVSPLNRGTFYGCRNLRGELEGVGLIGHAILLETRTDRALLALAEVAQKSKHAHMILGEQDRVLEFWSHFSEVGQRMRLACRELLFEQRWPLEVREEIRELRLASLADIEAVMPVHARMAFDESGINPLEQDAEGFRQRYARRIVKGRTWVWFEDGTLSFKADIIADTPEVIYLEGVWINPEKRSRGYGLRCLSQLARNLLGRTQSLCLFVNERNKEAHQFYRKAGYQVRALYDTIFLE